MKPKFEVYAVHLYERMDMDLMQLKRENKLSDDFYTQLRQFFIDYLEAAKEAAFIHGDIKPRLRLDNKETSLILGATVAKPKSYLSWFISVTSERYE